MNVWGYISIGFLVIVVVLVLRGIRGHKQPGNLDGGLDRIGFGGGDQADGY